MNDVDDIRRAMAIFDQVCDLSPQDRSAALDELCKGDTALRNRVERMVAVENDDHAMFGDSGQGSGARILSDELSRQSHGEHLPEQIERYRILRELGRGGMGIVYEAEQENPRRRVALKVIRQAIVSADLQRRFRQEAHVLGQLRHPGIAQIIEAGTTRIGESELPYFTMELIEGVPLDAHAKTLRTQDRIELMARVCDAVQHAHQKGIIHRDLKPANVHVVRHETSTRTGSGSDSFNDLIGQPKIMDFGIARLTDSDVQVTTIQTHAGQIVGTLAYMSPEQVAGNSADLDTRCDVYALGVILYQLLSGHMPYDLGGKPIAEAARIIRDTEPRRLATLDSAFRGDLDTIVSKAIEKDPNRRYASAAALAEDLRRFLAREPISAHPPSAFYQLRKFAGRNKAIVGGALTTLIVLAAGLVVSSTLLVSVTRERNAKQVALDASDRERRAKQAALDASQEVTAFFTDMLAKATPEAMGKDVTVRDMLDKAGRDIGNRFAGRPLLEAKIRATMGATYRSLGEYGPADEQLKRAIEIYSATPDTDLSDLFGTKLSLAQLRFFQEDYEAALTIFDALLADLRDHPNLEPLKGQCSADRAMTLLRLGRMQEAERDMKEAIRLFEALDGKDAESVLAAKSNLAELLSITGNKNAESYYQDLIEQSRRIRGADHPETLLLIGNLARQYMRQSRHNDAIPLLRTIHATQVQTLGPAHRQTLVSLNNLAISLSKVKQFDEAKSLLEEAITLSSKENGETSATTLFLTYGLGVTLRNSGDYEEARSTLLRSADLHRRVLGPTSEGVWSSERELMILYLNHDKLDLASQLGESILQRLSESMPAEHWMYLETRYYLAKVYAKKGKFDDAERLLLAAEKSANANWQPAIRRELVQVYKKTDRPEEAKKWE